MVYRTARLAPVVVALCLVALPAAPKTARLEAQPALVRGQSAPPASVAPQSLADSTFGRLVTGMSEPGGFFDSDNLVSNELGYLDVLGSMRTLRVGGGAYIGVGPDQNFSYIAATHPSIAFMIDIRRDALLQHLMYKALFAQSSNRIEYLCQLLGKPLPSRSATWDTASIATMVRYLDATPSRRELLEQSQADIERRLRTYRVPLNAEDLAAIRRMHTAFYTDGLSTRYNSLTGNARNDYPLWRDLLVATDPSGRQENYLASEANFAVVKSLEDRNLIVPVTGDLSGPKAMAAIATYVRSRGETVSAFYVSNVESYLFRDGSFENFARNVARLPRDSRSVIIRSWFAPAPGGSNGEPQTRVTQMLQTMSSFVAQSERHGYETYSDVVAKDIIPNR